jgi:diphthamide biosynthesis protein 3
VCGYSLLAFLRLRKFCLHLTPPPPHFFHSKKGTMSSIYEEVEIEDMEYDIATQSYSYPCPCGDKFSISLLDLLDGENIGTCPSCTLRIKVIFEEESLPEYVETLEEI